jgi:DNA primase
MLVIPYLTKAGVKAIRFRNLGEGKPKFAQHAGQPARLYNTAAYFKADDTIGLAEGEIDAIAATEYLGVPTIGIPGAEMWTAHRAIWAPIFKNFARVLIFRDGDQAGQDLADAVSESLKYRARVISPPSGEDVSSMVAAGREKELTEKIANIDEDDEDDGDRGD